MALEAVAGPLMSKLKDVIASLQRSSEGPTHCSPIAHQSGTNPVPMMDVRRKCNLGKIENVIQCQEPISPKDTVNEAVDLYV